MNTPTCGILIRSYDGDLPWLEYCIRSIAKFCHGYDYLMVVADRETGGAVLGFCAKSGIPHAVDDESGKITSGYIGQQHTKMRSDLFMPNGVDVIVHIDSDVMATGNNTPDVLFANGKPVMLYSDYDDAPDAKAAWKGCTEELMARPVRYEFMRRFPLAYPRCVYSGARKWIEVRTGKPLLEYMKTTRRFSEFNLLGAWAWSNARNLFEWIPTNGPFPSVPFRQFWSHGKLPREELDILVS